MPHDVSICLDVLRVMCCDVLLHDRFSESVPRQLFPGLCYVIEWVFGPLLSFKRLYDYFLFNTENTATL